jgi:hypothetical protein
MNVQSNCSETKFNHCHFLFATGHQAMNETHVTNAEGATECEFLLKLQYTNVTMGQLLNLVDASGQCAQYISWRCHAAAISVVRKDGSSTTFTYWMNRNDKPRYYWDGSDSNSKLCACGAKGQCANPDRPCNCDSNDDVWRLDEGYIRNKQDLPITSICGGETGRPTLNILRT